MSDRESGSQDFYSLCGYHSYVIRKSPKSILVVHRIIAALSVRTL